MAKQSLKATKVKEGQKLETIYVRLSNARKWDKNPKKHDIKKLQASIRRYGFRDAPIWDTKLNALVGGNGRAEALELMQASGEKPPRGILEAANDGEWCVPVQVGIDAKSRKQAESFAVDHNNLTLAGLPADVIDKLWDEKGYDELVYSLDQGDEAPTSMSEDDLKKVALRLGMVEEDEIPEAQFDRADELCEKWGVESGQLWQLGEHRVIVGDCTDKVVVERLMEGERIGMMVTDPPYGVDYTGGDTTPRERLANDANANIYSLFLPSIKKYLFDYAPLYIWYADVRVLETALALNENGWIIRSGIVWHKTNAHFGSLGRQYKMKHETMFYCFQKGKPPQWFGATNEVSIWEQDQPNTNKYHPTQKPVELIEKAIKNSSQQDDVIFDGFLGSGTTLLACERLNRKCHGIEIEPKYVAVTLERWHEMTGEIPVLVD